MINSLFIDFIMFSILGWVYECIYCSVRAGCWQNMGFLFGPVCPIYGTGAVTVILMGMYITPIASGKIPFWQLFLFFAIGSAVLEYVTSWAMEKRFHARWWDYSDMPFHINGRICLPASILFGIVGILILKYIIPALDVVHMYINPVAENIIALIFMAVFAADLALSIASMSQLLEIMEGIQLKMDMRIDYGIQAMKQIPSVVAGTSKKYTLNLLHRNHLQSIRSFSAEKQKAVAKSLKNMLMGIGENDDSDEK